MDSIKRLYRFFKEAYNELKQVSWLTKKEMIASTYVVIMVVIVMSLFISAIDFALSRFVGILLKI